MSLLRRSRKFLFHSGEGIEHKTELYKCHLASSSEPCAVSSTIHQSGLKGPLELLNHGSNCRLREREVLCYAAKRSESVDGLQYREMFQSKLTNAIGQDRNGTFHYFILWND